jgi:hypothetical protein
LKTRENFWRICRCAHFDCGSQPDVSHLVTFLGAASRLGHPEITSVSRGAAREASQTRSVWIRRNQAFRVEDAEGIYFWRICRCANFDCGLNPDVSHLATFLGAASRLGHPEITSVSRGAAREGSQTRSVWITEHSPIPR